MNNLSRFTQAQQQDYQTALNEIKAGRKRSHWMWYIFPQIVGLGKSSMAVHYAIRNIEEAKAFLQDSYLGKNLTDICEALLSLDSDDATAIFGRPDDVKLRSSMTLFACASEGDSVFRDVLKKFFHGAPDNKTLDILGMKRDCPG